MSCSRLCYNTHVHVYIICVCNQHDQRHIKYTYLKYIYRSLMKSEKAKIIFNLVNKNILFYSLCTFPHFSVQTGPEGRFRGEGLYWLYREYHWRVREAGPLLGSQWTPLMKIYGSATGLSTFSLLIWNLS